jgi:predicted DNA binding CopG/RHH family protein
MVWRHTLAMTSPNYDLREFLSRSPKRITITIPHSTFEAIAQRSNIEGRSMSNLIAFILECNINRQR